MKPNPTKSDYVAANAANTDSPCFVDNLISLSSECSGSAKGMRNSSANGQCIHRVFIEFETEPNKEVEKVSLRRQGCSWDEELIVFTGTASAKGTLFRSSDKQFQFFLLINLSRVVSNFASLVLQIVPITVRHAMMKLKFTRLNLSKRNCFFAK